MTRDKQVETLTSLKTMLVNAQNKIKIAYPNINWEYETSLVTTSKNSYKTRLMQTNNKWKTHQTMKTPNYMGRFIAFRALKILTKRMTIMNQIVILRTPCRKLISKREYHKKNLKCTRNKYLVLETENLAHYPGASF